KAIEDEPVGRLLRGDPLADHADDHLVGYEISAVHVLLGRTPQLGPLTNRRPQDVASRPVRQLQVLLQPLSLRALTAAWRSEENEIKLSHDFLSVEIDLRTPICADLQRPQTISGSPHSCASSAAPRAASRFRAQRQSRSGSRFRRRRSWPRSG